MSKYTLCIHVIYMNASGQVQARIFLKPAQTVEVRPSYGQKTAKKRLKNVIFGAFLPDSPVCCSAPPRLIWLEFYGVGGGCWGYVW